MLHLNNGSAHSSNLIQDFLIEYSIVQIRQLQYSSDMVACFFWFLSKFKNQLSGNRLIDFHSIQQNAMKVPENSLQKCNQH